ncbi:hypothetical protein RUM43_008934 [Polyplax serrata]|uniref:Uncharacterized protein n=1 Tax=Polyplax serrata TaxID=468196 RepID=A0AAN8NV50_POLSC
MNVDFNDSFLFNKLNGFENRVTHSGTETNISHGRTWQNRPETLEKCEHNEHEHNGSEEIRTEKKKNASETITNEKKFVYTKNACFISISAALLTGLRDMTSLRPEYFAYFRYERTACEPYGKAEGQPTRYLMMIYAHYQGEERRTLYIQQ